MAAVGGGALAGSAHGAQLPSLRGTSAELSTSGCAAIGHRMGRVGDKEGRLWTSCTPQHSRNAPSPHRATMGSLSLQARAAEWAPPASQSWALPGPLVYLGRVAAGRLTSDQRGQLFGRPAPGQQAARQSGRIIGVEPVFHGGRASGALMAAWLTWSCQWCIPGYRWTCCLEEHLVVAALERLMCGGDGIDGGADNP